MINKISSEILKVKLSYLSATEIKEIALSYASEEGRSKYEEVENYNEDEQRNYLIESIDESKDNRKSIKNIASKNILSKQELIDTLSIEEKEEIVLKSLSTEKRKEYKEEKLIKKDNGENDVIIQTIEKMFENITDCDLVKIQNQMEDEAKLEKLEIAKRKKANEQKWKKNARKLGVAAIYGAVIIGIVAASNPIGAVITTALTIAGTAAVITHNKIKNRKYNKLKAKVQKFKDNVEKNKAVHQATVGNTNNNQAEYTGNTAEVKEAETVDYITLPTPPVVKETKGSAAEEKEAEKKEETVDYITLPTPPVVKETKGSAAEEKEAEKKEETVDYITLPTPPVVKETKGSAAEEKEAVKKEETVDYITLPTPLVVEATEVSEEEKEEEAAKKQDNPLSVVTNLVINLENIDKLIYQQTIIIKGYEDGLFTDEQTVTENGQERTMEDCQTEKAKYKKWKEFLTEVNAIFPENKVEILVKSK